MSRADGLALSDGRTNDNITEEPRIGRFLVTTRSKFIHRERQHIGRSRLVHPFDVQLLHRDLVDKNDCEIRVGMNLHRRENMCRKGVHCFRVDIGGGFVDNVYGHDDARFRRGVVAVFA